MPVYGSAPSGQTGLGALVWSAETPAVGTASVPVVMGRTPNFPNCLGVEIAFAAAPGAFQIDLETADTDQDKYYVVKGSIGTGTPLNAQFVGRIEITNIVAKFARLRMVSRTNAVAVTAKLS